MRFIGNKENLIGTIYQSLLERKISGQSFFDFFAGTTNVSKFFKKEGYQIFSSDLLYFSYVLQKAYLSNNRILLFERLLQVLDYKPTILFASPLQIVIEYLNQIPNREGFIYKNYTPYGSRMYFSEHNGLRIDAIRYKIEEWRKENLLYDDEYYVLLACLIESVPFYANVSGVYATFQKKWDPRALKKLTLRPIEIIVNNFENICFNQNSIDLIDDIEADIFYLDPPYNQRQYAPNYHLLETIAKYDNPQIKGITGLRANYEEQKSLFCNRTTALLELDKIVSMGRYKTLILSYNDEGIMSQEQIIAILQKYGKTELFEFDYLRFKSNNNGENKNKKYIKEQLYILRKK